MSAKTEVCGACRFWCGRCLKGKRVCFASSNMCDLFVVRPKATEEQINERKAKRIY